VIKQKSSWPLLAFAILFLTEESGAFQKTKNPAPQANSSASSAPKLGSENASQMRPVIEWYAADRANLQRFYNVEGSEERQQRLQKFYSDWLAGLSQINFKTMSQAGKIDYIVFRNALEHEQRVLDLHRQQDTAAKPFIPFAPIIMELEVSRQQMQPMEPRTAAEQLSKLTHAIEDTRKSVEAMLKMNNGADAARERKIHAARAVTSATTLRNTLRTWFTFYNGYNPEFTWWAADDYRKADAALQSYIAFLSERVLELKSAGPGSQNSAAHSQETEAGSPGGGRNATVNVPAATPQPGETGDIIGNPIGRDSLMSELAYEMIPYTPEELIAIANKEFTWCEAEMKKASSEMGYGDDWKKALENVKNMYVEPGKQPQVIRELALDAVKFMDDHDLVTIPPVARETWRMQMMSPERQLVNPFFTGGETISVSYPTDAMSYEDKLMSMRGNNVPFSKATVFHELIPGHELQGYMFARYRPYRGLAFGRSAFVTEGWSLYWELLLWDMHYQKTPAERIGALFWHMHRCARIIFSLSFHLGRMTAGECINFLVDRVGFERANAIGEVRRSFTANYGVLYQAGYLLGGMQLYALHKELVDSGKMTNRQFHDATLRENYIPIEMMRADLEHLPLTADYKTTWKFRGDVTAQ
jgi:uncharacterized protein (DUF885 family)